MNLMLRIGLAASIAAGMAACSSASNDEELGTTSSTGEALSTTDVLVTRGYLPIRHTAAPKPRPFASPKDLSYRGGPLIQNGKVYTVFWGANAQAGRQDQLGSFFQSVGPSAYVDWLHEYDVNGSSINHARFAGKIVDTSAPSSSTITNTQIQQELDRLFTSGDAPAPDNDSLYMVYFPPNVSIDLDGQATSCQQFCAYHYTYTRSGGQNVYYGVMPDLTSGGCESGCGYGSALDNITEVSSHEWIEATTDPAVGLNILSWYNDTYGEIGDICVTYSPSEDGTINGFTVQKEWSNASSGCIVTGGPAPDGGTDAGDGGDVDAGDGGDVDAGDGGDVDAGDGGDVDAGDGGPPPTCANGGTHEVEPNDDATDADPLVSAACGALDPKGDRDLYSFSLPAHASYDLVLTPSGDATIALYKNNNGKLQRVSSTSPTEVKHSTTRAGSYIAVVKSPTKSLQSYSLTLGR